MAADVNPWSDEDVERFVRQWKEGSDLRSVARRLMDEAVAIASEKEEVLADAKLGREMIARLSAVVGDSGNSEGALECLDRILAERHSPREAASSKG